MISAESQTVFDRRLLPVALFTGSYLLAAVVFAFARGNLEFVFYIAVMAVLIGVVLVVHRRVSLAPATLWCLSVWGALHMAGGLVHVPVGWPVAGDSNVLYNLWLLPQMLKFDQVVHAYGFGVATWVCWQGLRAGVGGQPGRPVQPTPGLVLLAATAGMGLGAVNEVIEFAAVLLLPNTNVGGYINTGWDLVANMFGSLVAAVLIYLSARRRDAGQ
ncbi:MAG: hypothetical protein V2J12_13310 [Gammaproteobacteria bacterium]|nr:hypothetical protein [Gammaproteobacteria bacterium]